MVELIRIESKINEENDTKQIAKSAADNYRSFLKSRAVFAPEGDLGQRGGSGRSHSFKARRFSEVKALQTLPTNVPEGKPRRSHSSDNILEEVQRYERQHNEHVHTQSNETGDTPNNVKRSKFEYIKQLFSKKPDKPRKSSTPTLPSPSQAPRASDIFHRPSDVTSNYSTSDYASDQELDDTTVYPKQLPRSPLYANRNSKIASIVKRFEPLVQTDNPTTSTPPPELIERTHSQALLEIQAISSNLSSLMTNISSFSAIGDTHRSDLKPTKQLVVETLMEPQINEDKKHTPKITTSYSLDEKQYDVTLDNCQSSEHGDDVISLDDFLTNLAPPKRPLLPSRYTLIPREEEPDSDSTEMGSGSLQNSTDILLEEVNKTVAEMTSSIKCNETDAKTADPNSELTRPPYIDINSKQLSSIDDKITRVMENLSPDIKHRKIRPPSLLPVYAHTDMTSQSIVTPQISNTGISQDSTINVTSSVQNTRDNLIANSNAENALPPILKPQELAVEMKSPLQQVDLNFVSKSLPNHRHALSCEDGDVTELHHPLNRCNTLDDLTTSPLLPTRINILDTQSTDYSDVTSTHSMPLSPVNTHKYTGYSLPSGQTASVSDRIRSLLSKQPIDHHKVDKLTIARAAIERKKSEVKPAYACPVLIELSQPEEFSFKSLRERFEVRMKQMEPSGVMLSPSQLPPPARKKSEDLGIKPIFAGDTKKFSSIDVIAMRSEYNTDGDANTNKSLVQPKYIIK